MSADVHFSQKSAAGAASQTAQVWPVAGADFHPRRPMRLRHTFTSHPLMQLPALQRLAEKFRAQGRDLVKFVRQGTTSADPLVPLSHDPSGRSIAEVFARIEEPGSWISLYHVEADPEYAEMIREVSLSAATWSELLDPGAFDWAGFVFVSSPPSATPFHIDRENNFFFQVHGRKRLSVWDPADRQVVPEIEIEHKIGRGADSKVRFDPSYYARAVINDELGPGDGAYIPSTSGHTTNTESLPSGTDDTYSVSIGVVYYTRATRRAAYSYVLNDHLRRLGFAPRPPYESSLLDRLKYPVGRSIALVKQGLRGFEIPPGM